jgi:hypothetical protein
VLAAIAPTMSARALLRSLFSLQGTIGAGRYLATGAALMGLKFGLDAAVCELLQHSWSPLLYLAPLSWGHVPATDPSWLWPVLAAASLPFAWAGVALSVRRLRDAALDPLLVAFFAVPLVNLGLFAVLCLVPTRVSRVVARPEAAVRVHGPLPIPALPTRPAPARRAPALVRRSPALLGASAAGVLILLSTLLLKDYGTTLFVFVPFLHGLIVGSRHGRWAGGIEQYFLSVLLLAGTLLIIAAEGMVCIVMAAPIWFLFGLLGLHVGIAIASARSGRTGLAPAIVAVPLSMWFEPHARPEPSVFAATTCVVVEAAAAQVWQHLVAFPELPPPTELPFRLGISYPIGATIEGNGVGAVRRCRFSTGDFVEPITVWDEPRLLAFAVAECPPPMVEWNPFHDHVDAPHLHGWFRAHRGQFRLVDRGDGTTLLEGTTWYSHGLWPESYWRWWSEYLLHAIHGRVLEHIRTQATSR